MELEGDETGGTEPVVVRRLRPGEWARLREIRLRALADAPDAFGSTLEAEAGRDDDAWQDWASRKDRVVVVAEQDGRFVGMASGGRGRIAAGTAGLYAMWVEPAARGSGVAARIVAAVEAWAREAGYGAIGLGVTTTNPRAVRFYERLGYVDTGERHRLRDGSDLMIEMMVKPLRPATDPAREGHP
jgi:GNAT superfamily N-acetyltransferase